MAGGEFIYAQQVFGDRTAFIVGWLSTLSLIAVAVFEATALPWLFETLLPGLKGPTLYVSLDTPVTADALAIGLIGTAVVAIMNYRGARSAATLQTVLAFMFLTLAVLIITLGLALGSRSNLMPLFRADRANPWWVGALWIFAIAPFFLNGFQSVAQAVEERTEQVTYARIASCMALALLAGTGFYCLVTLAAAAFANLLPRHGSPTGAVLLVAACTGVGACLGRGVIIPVVDMASLCLAGCLVLSGAAALRVRATRPGVAPYRTPGGAATLLYALLGSAGMAAFALLDPILRRPGQVPIEWIVAGAWTAVGIVFWCVRRER